MISLVPFLSFYVGSGINQPVGVIDLFLKVSCLAIFWLAHHHTTVVASRWCKGRSHESWHHANLSTILGHIDFNARSLSFAFTIHARFQKVIGGRNSGAVEHLH